jgi:hypothetical protein
VRTREEDQHLSQAHVVSVHRNFVQKKYERKEKGRKKVKEFLARSPTNRKTTDCKEGPPRCVMLLSLSDIILFGYGGRVRIVG